jgi:predicted Fe-S protein YdhL (DUF1289 family)
MSENIKAEIKSPCIGVCVMDAESGLCHGCYRTIEEIKTWWDLEQDAQQDLLVTLEERQMQQVSFD